MRTAIFFLLGVSAFCAACAALGLSPKDATKIADCQEIGRACKDAGGSDCYAAYDACMIDGGLR